MKLNKKDIIIGLAGGIVTIGIGFNALYYETANVFRWQQKDCYFMC